MLREKPQSKVFYPHSRAAIKKKLQLQAQKREQLEMGGNSHTGGSLTYTNGYYMASKGGGNGKYAAYQSGYIHSKLEIPPLNTRTNASDLESSQTSRSYTPQDMTEVSGWEIDVEPTTAEGSRLGVDPSQDGESAKEFVTESSQKGGGKVDETAGTDQAGKELTSDTDYEYSKDDFD